MIPALAFQKISSANTTEEIAPTTQRIAEDYTRHRVTEMEDFSTTTDHLDVPQEEISNATNAPHLLTDIPAHDMLHENDHVQGIMTHTAQDMSARTDRLHDNHFQILHPAAPTLMPIRTLLQTLPLQD